MAKRALKWVGITLGGLAALLVIAFVSLLILARTPWGMERARRFAQNWLTESDRVAGALTFDRITGDGLLSGATVHGILIADPAGQTFLSADSIRGRYDILNLLRGRIVIRDVDLWGAKVHVEKWPGDSAWNFQHIFPGGDNSSPDSTRTRRRIRFDPVRIHDADVELIQPVVDEQGGLAARFVTRQHGDGRVRVMNFDGINGIASTVAWSDPGNAAKVIDVTTLSATVRVFDEPFTLEDLEGRIILQDSIVGLDIRSFRLPESEGKLSGRLINGENGTRYDLNIHGSGISTSDLAWMDPRVPTGAHGSFDLRLATQPDGSLLLWFPDLDFEAGTTRVTGAFGYVAGDRPALRDVDLTYRPLDLAWLQTQFGDSVRFSGLLSGRVRAAGPLSAVRTNGNARLTGAGPADPSDVQWSGTIRLDGVVAARGLAADVTAFDLSLIDRFRPGLGLEGVVTGRIEVDGRLAQGMTVRTTMSHQLDGLRSDFDGGGSIRSDSVLTLDLAFDARPLRLETLGRFVPAIDRLNGQATGRFTLVGPVNNLRVAGNMTTAAGPLAFDATIDRRAREPRFIATGQSGSFTPSRIGLIDNDVFLSGLIAFDLTGTDAQTMRGPLRLELDSAVVNGLPIERSNASLILGGGRVTVDSARIYATGLTVTADGEFGIVAGRADSLHLVLASESLEPLESILFDEVIDPTKPRVSGSGRAVATLIGTLQSFDASVDGTLQRPQYDGRTASMAHISGNIRGVRTDSVSYDLTVDADSVVALDGFADSVRVGIVNDVGIGSVALRAWHSGASTVRVESDFQLTETGSQWQLTVLDFASGPGEWTLGDTAAVTIDGRLARIEGLRLIPNFGGEVAATGTLAWSDAETPGSAGLGLDFDVDLRQVPFGLIPPAARPKGDVRGTIDGAMHIGGSAGSPTITASVDVSGVEYEGAGLERVEARLRYVDLLLDVQMMAYLDGREVLHGNGAVPLDLRLGATTQRLLDRPIDFTVNMDSFPAAFALGFTRGFSDVQGILDGSVEASGSARAPALSGAFLLRRGAATVGAIGVRYVDGEGTFRMDRELTADVDFTARTVDPRSGSRGGTARVTGSIDLSKATDPAFDLTLTANRILAAKRRDVEATASGVITIGGQYTRPELTGSITIDGGNLYIDEIYRQYLIVQLEDPLLFEVIDTSSISGTRVLPETTNPFLRNMLLEDMQVTVNSGSWLRGREMNVEVSGELAVLYDRQNADLRLSGSLRAIRGTYRLEYPPIARVFEVREGTVAFPGTPGLDPNLNITAVYTARTGGEPLDIYADVTGTLQSPRVTLRSDAQPPISESDLASYLFLGAPTYAFNASSSSGVFGSLGSQFLTNTGLGYFASGLQTLGQNFGILDYVGLSAAESGPGQTGASPISNVLSSTKIELGRYLTPRLFITYTQRLNAEPGVRLEWRINPIYTAELFAEDRFARAPSFGLSQAIATRRVFGFWFYREWGY